MGKKEPLEVIEREKKENYTTKDISFTYWKNENNIIDRFSIKEHRELCEETTEYLFRPGNVLAIHESTPGFISPIHRGEHWRVHYYRTVCIGSNAVSLSAGDQGSSSVRNESPGTCRHQPSKGTLHTVWWVLGCLEKGGSVSPTPDHTICIEGKSCFSQKSMDKIISYPFKQVRTYLYITNQKDKVKEFLLKTRNTTRGIRSEEAVKRRRENRIERKKISRVRARENKEKRRDPSSDRTPRTETTKNKEETERILDKIWHEQTASIGEAGHPRAEALRRLMNTIFQYDPSASNTSFPQATAQEVKTSRTAERKENAKSQEYKGNLYGKMINLGTLNIRSTIRAGIREETEKWMTDNHIDILFIQETKQAHTTKEARGQFTWYFSGKNKNENDNSRPIGVGMVIKNSLNELIEQLEAVTDKLMTCTFNFQPKLTCINVYMLHAQHTEEDKEAQYEELQKIIERTNNNHPIIILGDFNARIQCRNNQNANETQVIGPHTFDKDNVDIDNRSEQVKWNRQILIDFCLEKHYIVANTWFQKQNHKLATFMEIGTRREHNIKRGNWEQIDFILIQHRWRNAIRDCESDTMANIDSDHCPIKVKICAKYKAPKKNMIKNQKYEKCSQEQNEKVNKAYKEEIRKSAMELNKHPNERKMYMTYNAVTSSLDKAQHEMTRKANKRKQEFITNETWEILNKRKQALVDSNGDEFIRLTKLFRKNEKKDKLNSIIQPYSRTKNGVNVSTKNITEEIAKYLAEIQWQHDEKQKQEIAQGTPKNNQVGKAKKEDFDTTNIKLEELKWAIKSTKRNKAPGPNNISIDTIRELNDEQLQDIVNLLNEWWNNYNIPREETQARIFLLFKKGNTTKFENYKPISLLNSLYKLFARIIHKRISQTLDKHLQKTQYGFWKDRSTADALAIVRKLQNIATQTNQTVFLVLLDWEKAFDKVDRNKLFWAMERMNIHDKLIKVCKSIYRIT